jgi:phosphoglycolate phosphatase
MVSHFKAVLFDFDFTLADSSAALCECVNYGLSSLGFSEASENDIIKTSGMTMTNIFRTLSSTTDVDNTQSFIRFFTEKADETMATKTVIYPGVPDLLHSLQASNIKTGIISTKYRYRIEEILARDSFSHHVDIIIGGEDVTSHKPDPQGIGLALERLQLSPAEILYVGDTTIDAETARNAGTSFIGVLSGTTPKEDFYPYNPIAILNSVIELLHS